MYKVEIDKKKCVGCGLCPAVCGEVFEMKGDKARVKTSKTDKTCAKEAAEQCPERAIIVEEV
ncbi:ferredoxin [Candidatus Pacearchaeota archaeon]|nr:ferredoxin [Candidatus Pacearchaeota archaeon]